MAFDTAMLVHISLLLNGQSSTLHHTELKVLLLETVGLSMDHRVKHLSVTDLGTGSHWKS